jgi:hypothetical protein
MNEHLPDAELEPAPQPLAGDPVQPPRTSRTSHRTRAGTFLQGATLLSTTALAVVLDPKIPPFRGD